MNNSLKQIRFLRNIRLKLLPELIKQEALKLKNLNSAPKPYRRVVKYGLIAGGAFAGWYYWPEISFFSRAMTRISRTAGSVALLAMDYKYTLTPYWKLVQGRRLLEDEEVRYEQIKSQLHERSAKRLLKLFQKNGGVYIKLGQHLAALDFILPPEYCSILSTLHSQAPASPPEDVCMVFLEELGSLPQYHHIKSAKGMRDVDKGRAIMESIFSKFDWKPIGAASLAQVHLAERLDGGNQAVAIKIQHRQVSDYASLDMATASVAVKWINRIFPNFEFSWLADEIRTNLPKELNFVQEGHNAERLAKYQDPIAPSLIIPKIHWDLSTRRILVMENVGGDNVFKINQLAKLKTMNINLRKVSERLTKAYSEMIFLTGFVHCDPHPGNILVRKNTRASGGFDLILLDHGLYKELSDEFRIKYARLWKAVIDCDEPEISRLSTFFGNGEAHRLFSSMLTHRSWDRLSSLGNLTSAHSLAELQAIRTKAPLYLEKIAHVLSALPRDMLLLLKTNDLLRSIERKLSSESDWQLSRSFLIMAQFCSQAILKDDHKNNKGFFVSYFRLEID
jgi:aarF domain-containing kinase